MTSFPIYYLCNKKTKTQKLNVLFKFLQLIVKDLGLVPVRSNIGAGADTYLHKVNYQTDDMTT